MSAFNRTHFWQLNIGTSVTKLINRLLHSVLVPLKEEWPTIALIAFMLGCNVDIWLHPFATESHHFGAVTLYWLRNVSVAYVFGALICLASHRWQKCFIRFILITTCSALLLLEVISYSIFNLHISLPLVTLFFETNSSEVRSTISIIINHYGLYTTIGRFLLLITTYIIALIFRVRVNSGIKNIVLKIFSSINISILYLINSASAIIFSMIIIGLINFIINLNFLRFSTPEEMSSIYYLTVSNTADMPTRIAYTLKVFSELKKEFNEWENTQKSFIANGEASCHATDSLKVIGIIGESFIYSHASVNGYQLNTTPRLASECSAGNMVAYSDVNAYDCYTTRSIQSIMATQHHTAT